jgi:hypothetical protein
LCERLQRELARHALPELTAQMLCSYVMDHLDVVVSRFDAMREAQMEIAARRVEEQRSRLHKHVYSNDVLEQQLTGGLCGGSCGTSVFPKDVKDASAFGVKVVRTTGH